MNLDEYLKEDKTKNTGDANLISRFVGNEGIQPHVIQFIYEFPNGYGASVVIHRGSYNIETAVITFNKDGMKSIVYNTPVTNDVLGYQTPVECYNNLIAIYNLPERIKSD